MLADFAAAVGTFAGGLYLIASLLLVAYVANGYVLLARCLWTRGRSERERRRLFAEGAKMLVLGRGEGTAIVTQIPLYNEATVAGRIIRAAAAMEWPHGRHTVQVLDDSTDETRGIVDAVAAQLRAEGADVVVVRRADRAGFKAGALAHGMTLCEAEFIAIFDSDFVPPPDFLLRAVPALVADPKLGWAQGRWTHLNADDNVLTRAQAAGIDAHFIIEQQARAAGWFMNFNGTGGVWRRRAIEDAGGWSDATLTEDLDLSYRAQLRGWRGLFLPEVAVPGEVPADAAAFKCQQFRWAKGSLQTALRLLPAVLRSERPIVKKIQAVFHLTNYLMHPLLVLLVLMTPWMALASPTRGALFASSGWAVFVAATVSGFTYLCGQAMLGHPWRVAFARLNSLLAAGTGPALTNVRAAIEALVGHRSEFVRTPKQGGFKAHRYRARAITPPWLDAAFGIYAIASVIICIAQGWLAAVPMLIFAASGSLCMVLKGDATSPEPRVHSEGRTVAEMDAAVEV